MEDSEKAPKDTVESDGKLNQADFRKIALIQAALQDRELVVGSDSGFTAEAWEPDRRNRLHKQLMLARRLRMDLEAACAVAEKGSLSDARDIFTSKIDRMNELVSLTQAVLGKYTLKSYKNYRDADAKEEEAKLDAQLYSQSILNNHKKAMAYERDISIYKHDVMLQAEENERNAKQLAKEQERNAKQLAKEKDRKAKQIVIAEKLKPVNERASRIPRNLPPKVMNSLSVPKRRSSSTIPLIPPKVPLPQDEKNVKKRRRPVEVKQTMSTQENESRLSPDKKRMRQIPTMRQVEKSVSSKVPSVVPKTTTVPPKKMTSRKCHYCKKNSSTFRQCHFYFITGDKCRKCYCMECLVTHFDFKESKDMRDEDWYCPSCLGNCTCTVCVRKREKEERSREARRGTRTSRRTKY